jgi:hypothetical protein
VTQRGTPKKNGRGSKKERFTTKSTKDTKDTKKERKRRSDR